MPGHPRLAWSELEDVDARDKPGRHDPINRTRFPTKGAEQVSPSRPCIIVETRSTSAEQAARLDLDARAHGGRNRHALDVGALGAGGFCLGDRVRERLDVLHQLLLRERSLADAGL